MNYAVKTDRKFITKKDITVKIVRRSKGETRVYS